MLHILNRYPDTSGLIEKDRGVSGRVRNIDDTELRRKCIEERPFIKDMGITDPEDRLLAVFHLFTGEAYFWTRADSMKEADIPRIKF